MAEARIKTTFGEIVVAYSSLDELNKALEDVPKAVALVQSKISGIVPAESRKPKPGCEHIYEFDSNGRLQLLKKPTKKVALAALALYASDPDPMSPSDLEFVTGLSEVVKSVLGQTENKKYFVQKGDGKYGLTPFGFEWVPNKVTPTLR
jgi:hypothetical protein